MKPQLIRTGVSAVLLSSLLTAHAGEPARKVKITKATRTEFSTAGYQPIKQFHGDLTLVEAVGIALRQNPDILRAVQEIERTRGLIIEVRAQALPQITLTGSYDQQDRRLLESGGGGGAGGATGDIDFSQFGGVPNQGNGSGTPGNGGASGQQTIDFEEAFAAATRNSGQRGGAVQNKSWRVAIEARQVLYAGGQIRAALQIARLTEDSAYFQLLETIDRIISETRQQFYLVLLNRALINVAEEAVRLAEEQLQDQRNRFEAGTVPRFNVLRAEVELANERPNLIRARNDFLIAKFQLAKLLGLDPGPGGRPAFTAVGDLTISPRPVGLEEALALARARRPFLKVQRLNILIEAEQIKVAMAGYKPRLDARAGYEVRNRRSSDDLGDTVNGWFFGFNGSWDIFDGFETFGQVKQARARLESAKINYEDSVRQVELEVQTAYANLLQARETIESQQANVEQAREALRLAEERLSAGAGTQLEVLDARVALTRAQTTELQARADYNRALAEFDRAVALDTVYDTLWKDPLLTTERSIFEKIASIGLRKPGTGPITDAVVVETTTKVTRSRKEGRAKDGKSTR